MLAWEDTDFHKERSRTGAWEADYSHLDMALATVDMVQVAVFAANQWSIVATFFAVAIARHTEIPRETSWTANQRPSDLVSWPI